jgi:hypothetical protein
MLRLSLLLLCMNSVPWAIVSNVMGGNRRKQDRNQFVNGLLKGWSKVVMNTIVGSLLMVCSTCQVVRIQQD